MSDERVQGDKASLEKLLDKMREKAKTGRDPTAADETVNALIGWVREHKAERILEIGAGEGLTSCALLLNTEASLLAVELNAERAEAFRNNVKRFGVNDRARLIEGDAGEVLPCLTEPFDLIFLDGPKVQYRRYFDDLKRLTKRGGALFSDDVLLFGWVKGSAPKKREMLVEHLREYLALLTSDKDFKTEIYEYGEGLAISIRL